MDNCELILIGFAAWFGGHVVWELGRLTVSAAHDAWRVIYRLLP